ncbi:FCD domain-containing protein [Variovorax sp. J22G73]|uniref:FadR/GntR family transcriptional regulator n=1 Tax=unclassified Variovorax TaxID=663243 RepID=UPI0025789938|nr:MULTISPECIES: FCD domain-containing protein [unclassified Variovorax]MDM0008223.1 FCD domain-containing protein [Variovorax sp. J22R203]MDM0100729.1 FCD domain-containing protein [Variovorax sp. J22G73]
MKLLDPTRPRSLSAGIADALNQRIRVGPLRAGDQLPTEAAIMREFGVSRTVVREALSKLQAAGVVRAQRGVGSFVTGASRARAFRVDSGPDDSLPQAVALIELRIGLETEAAALAAQRRSASGLASLKRALDAIDTAKAQHVDTAFADFQFHLEIARASQSPHFAAVLEALGPRCVPTALLVAAGRATQGALWTKQVADEHRDIFEAISRQDADAARAAMRLHLTNGRERRRACELPRRAAER